MIKAGIIIENAYIVTMNKERMIFPNFSIAIIDDKIAAIGPFLEIKANYFSDKVIDGKGKIVFPGFINTHTHLFQVLLKGLGRDKPLLDWLNSSVRRALCNIDEECCYYSALAGCIELIRTGATTVLDYMYCQSHEGHSDAVLRAMEDVGIRGILGRSKTSTEDFPEEYACTNIDTEEKYFADVERLAEKYKNHSRLSIAIAPGIIWDLTDKGFRKTREIASRLGIPITMHLVETEDDDEYCVKEKGMRSIPYLEKMGILGPDFIAVHCVHLNDEEIALFKKYDVSVSYNPVSNMILASGIAPIPKFMEAGLTISLAVDGAASNDSQDMLEVIKTAALLQKVHTRNASIVSAADVLEMATLGGAKSVLMEDKIGSLEVGKKADMFLYNPLKTRSIPIHDPISSIVYSSSQPNIETSIIDGRLVLENGKILGVDEDEILYKTQEIAEKLVEKSGLGNTQWGHSIKMSKLR